MHSSLHVHPYLSACPLQIILSLIAPSLFDPLQHTHTHTHTHPLLLLLYLLIPGPSSTLLWFPCCTLACSRSIYNHGFWGLYLLPLRCYNHGYQSPATCITFPFSLNSRQVSLGRLRRGGEAQWLPGHRLPPLPPGRGATAGRRAIRALHGGARGLRLLQAPVVRPDALGVRPPVCSSRPREVLRKVPALYSVHSGKGVPPRRELLLYL